MRMNHARRGNAIVVALGVFTFAAVMVTTAVDSSVVTSRIAGSGAAHQRALAALDAVLARREVEVIERASQGDPVEIARWSTNYGVDFVGDAEVRWKIEPVRTPPRDASGNPVSHVTNPSPDPNWTVPTTAPVDSVTGEPFWQANDTNFMYRIAGEARVGVDPNAGTGTNQAGQPVQRPATVVQGARYASILQEPLFRYVIFYAARGAKGDLELSHADDVNIQGAVHTNGALYIGGGLKVNDEIARLGALKGDLTPAATRIGPDVNNDDVRVNGVDGVFRLSKPLMFTIINSFPRTNTAVPGVHGSPSDTSIPNGIAWTPEASYSLSPDPFPTDPTGMPFSSVLDATFQGRFINPYRIMGGTNSDPGSAAITESRHNNQDNLRTINRRATDTDPHKGVLRGVAYVTPGGGNVPNDSRDYERAADQKWTTISLQGSAPGFGGKVRTRLTGQNVKSLPERMRNRGFEPQRLEYIDTDGDDTTDEHESARPRFILANGMPTTRYPVAGAGFPEVGGQVQVIEDSGQYLRYALGSDASYMVRDPDGYGWAVRQRDNSLPDDPGAPGLIIRERPLPQPLYWPGTNSTAVVSPADPRWLPYAYGKHWYPSTFRFTVADVIEEMSPTSARPWPTSWTSNLNPLDSSRINTAANARVVSYSPGGILSMATAQRSGGTGGNAYSGFDDQYRRRPYYHAQNWRFVHLGQTQIDDSQNGLRVAVYNDRPTIPSTAVTTVSSYSLCDDGNAISLTAPATGVVAFATGANVLAGITPTVGGQHRSVRLSGYITATESNQYAFSTNLASNTQTADPQGVRIWVNGQLAFSNWGMNAYEGTNTLVRLSADKAVPIQIDYFNRAGATADLRLNWKKMEPTPGAAVAIPNTAFNPAAAQPGIARASFRSAEIRIDRPLQIAGPTQQKIGLMIRDGSGGMSPMISGSAPYALAGFSPARGFFSERQRFRHMQDSRSASQFYIGAGTGPSGAADASGQIIDNSNTVGTVNRTASLVQSALSAVTVQNSGPNNWTDISYGSTTWSAATPFSGTMSRDVGGGKIWTLLDGFSTGARTGSRTATPRAFTQVGVVRWRVLTLNLVGHVAPFIDADNNRTLRLFTGATGTGSFNDAGCDNDQFRVNATYLGAASTPPRDNRWYALGGTTDNRTQMRRVFWNESWPQNTNNGTTQTVTATVGGPGTIWSGGAIRINKNGVISNATLSDINTVTGMSFTQMNPSLPGLNLTSPSYPPYPAAPAFPVVADPTIPNFTGAGRTFSMQRLGITITFDLNSWITRLGSFFDPAAPTAQFLPTAGASWPLAWAGNAITTWPRTSSFRPDVYAGAAAPAYSGTAVNPVPPAVQAGSVAVASAAWRHSDDTGAPAPGTTEVWLRVESTTGNSLSLKGYAGTVPPAGPASYTIDLGTIDISNWGPSLLIGPAVQSGDPTQITTVTFNNMSITTALPAPNDVIDATDWDSDTSGDDIMGRYLASQYQVWWGPREITEDFFTWADPATGRRIASEDWIYNTREFWSQSRWWDHLAIGNSRVSKDSEVAPNTTFNNTRLREALAKTTMLTLDMAALQNYLRSRTLSAAISDRIAGANHDTGMPAVAGADDYVLRDRFSGLIYAVRTNRFPWNPNVNPYIRARLLAGDPSADTSGINPWSPSNANRLPNSWADMGDASPERGNDATLRSPTATWLSDATYGHLLQPYNATELALDPPLKPQQFHHGVRIINAASIDWGYEGTRTAGPVRSIGSSGTTATDWSWSPVPQFGISKTSIVTPNALCLQGNFNVDRHVSDRGGQAIPRFTPAAVMGDSITLLSNRFQVNDYQIPGVTVANVTGDPSVTGIGTLACATLGAFASDTEYNTAIATHNQPSTRDRVAEGQSAPFVDTTMFIENWDGRQMSYLGSLVVMDSRRYTRAFLHGSYKTYGQTPFGIVDNAPGGWIAKYNSFDYRRTWPDGTVETYRNGMYGPYWNSGTADWLGRSPIVYSEPRRVYQFNYDLLTEEGTPPFSPFGVSTSGVGGWARIIK